jgi:hypothetical protein
VRDGHLHRKSNDIVTTSRTELLKLALLAMMFSLTACVRVSRGPHPSFLPTGVLRLKAGEQHVASIDETWHSSARYQALEAAYLDAVSVATHERNNSR